MDENNGNEEMMNSKNADVFSFASIIFENLIDRDMVSHSLPFDEKENQKMNNDKLPMIPAFVPRIGW
jgi:hypothetical protein